MLAGQINLLKERAVAVAQLVRSLKTENESLKHELLTAQSRIASLTNEITRLRISSAKPVYTPPSYRVSTIPNAASDTPAPDAFRPQNGQTPEPAISASQQRQMPSVNSEAADTANALFKTADDTQPNAPEPQTEPPFGSESPTLRDFDPFFDTFSRFESDTASENTDAEFEFEYDTTESRTPVSDAPQPPVSIETALTSPETKEEPSLLNRDPDPNPPDKKPYSQLDIFY